MKAGRFDDDEVLDGVDGKEKSDLEKKFQDTELTFYVEETNRMKYMGPFYDYSDSIIQFGFVIFFSSVVPLMGLLALIENLLRIRLSAWKLIVNLEK